LTRFPGNTSGRLLGFWSKAITALLYSGFLITRNVLKRYNELNRVDFRQFYTMRIARIIPCLLLFLTAMTLLFWLGVDGFVPADALTSHRLDFRRSHSPNGYPSVSSPK
jgi:peptidoglycan/LPS O-acetylase OafA/YrhL